MNTFSCPIINLIKYDVREDERYILCNGIECLDMHENFVSTNVTFRRHSWYDSFSIRASCYDVTIERDYTKVYPLAVADRHYGYERSLDCVLWTSTDTTLLGLSLKLHSHKETKCAALISNLQHLSVHKNATKIMFKFLIKLKYL